MLDWPWVAPESAGAIDCERVTQMPIKTLIFDIGGTVFDWSSAIVEALDRVVPEPLRQRIDATAFSFACRSAFLDLNAAVTRGEAPWHTSDQMLSRALQKAWLDTGLGEMTETVHADLARSWRHMPAWPGARDAIRALRGRYVVAPLTILGATMAVGSSRRNGIDWDLILCCDILGIYKPDPRCYARAAEIVDCRPEEMMMVAVHPSDLRAAMACGYGSAFVKPRIEDPGEDYTDTGFRKEFDVVASDFEDLARQLVA